MRAGRTRRVSVHMRAIKGLSNLSAMFQEIHICLLVPNHFYTISEHSKPKLSSEFSLQLSAKLFLSCTQRYQMRDMFQ